VFPEFSDRDDVWAKTRVPHHAEDVLTRKTGQRIHAQQRPRYGSRLLSSPKLQWTAARQVARRAGGRMGSALTEANGPDVQQWTQEEESPASLGTLVNGLKVAHFRAIT